MRGTALALGSVGAVLGLVSVGLVVLGPYELTSPLTGVLIRVSAVLLAVSLVLPTIQRPKISTLVVAGAALVLVLLRPGLIWVFLVAWLGWVILQRQSINIEDSES